MHDASGPGGSRGGDPPDSRAAISDVLGEGACVSFAAEPTVLVRKTTLAEPTLEDPLADAARLATALGIEKPSFELEALRNLPTILRAHSFAVKSVVRGDRILEVRPETDTRRVLGASFDIGTTTIAGMLADLEDGSVLATGSRTNPQQPLGDDVISRMDHASKGRDELMDLQRRVAGAVSELIEQMTAGIGATSAEVFDITLAGNTVMSHLLLGLPPGAIAVVPFAPVSTMPGPFRATQLGLPAAPSAHLWITPSVSAYVGGDIVAGALATALLDLEGSTLFIDIGTNGEVVVVRDGQAVCAATAAGPAFEGAGISCGMRAVPGAISHARLDDGNLVLEVIDDAEARGVCGTGLVDLVAVFLQTGIVDQTGMIDESCGHALASRIRSGPNGPEIALTAEADSPTLTQRDLRELQLAKGAIAAGAGVLLQNLEIDPSDLTRVYLAGAFGSTISPDSAVAIGLLPQGIDPALVTAVGNTAASGTYAALTSRAARQRAVDIAACMKPIELSSDPAFQMLFAESMMFPAPSRT